MADKKLSAEQKKDQQAQQRDPDLQSYTSGGGSKASDPEQNIIIENDPRYQKDHDRDGQ